MTESEFADTIVAEARRQGYTVENSRNGRQIDFGHKKLHEGHLRALYPAIMTQGANVAALIEAVAPGRTCSHRPMKDILLAIQERPD